MTAEASLSAHLGVQVVVQELRVLAELVLGHLVQVRDGDAGGQDAPVGVVRGGVGACRQGSPFQYWKQVGLHAIHR